MISIINANAFHKSKLHSLCSLKFLRQSTEWARAVKTRDAVGSTRQAHQYLLNIIIIFQRGSRRI